MSRIAMLVVCVAGLIVGAAAHAGGRATVTVLAAPKQVDVGQVFAVSFAVRPELAMRREVEPVLQASQGGRTLSVHPVALKARGLYSATLALPEAGTWTLTVDS